MILSSICVLLYFLLILCFAFLSFKDILYGIIFYLIALPFHIYIKIACADALSPQIISLFQPGWPLFLYGVLFLQSLTGKRYPRIKWNILDKVVLLYLLWGVGHIISGLFIHGKYFVVLNGFRLYHFTVLFYFLCRLRINKKEDVYRVFKCLRLMFIVILGLTFIEELVVNLGVVSQYELFEFYSQAKDIPYLRGLEEGQRYVTGGIYRILGLAALPQITGAFIGIIFIYFLFNTSKKLHKLQKINIFLIIFAFCVFILATSKSAYFSLAFVGLYLLFLYRNKISEISPFFIMVLATIGLSVLIWDVGLYVGMFEQSLFFMKRNLIHFYLDFINLKEVLGWDFLWGKGFMVTETQMLRHGIDKAPGLLVRGPGWEVEYFTMAKQFGVIGLLSFFILNIIHIPVVVKMFRNLQDIKIKNCLVFCSASSLLIFIATVHYNAFIAFGINGIVFFNLCVISFLYSEYATNKLSK